MTGKPSVTGAVKMVRFSYSNRDTKDEEGREGCRPEMPLSRCHAPSLNHTSPLSRSAPQQPSTCRYFTSVTLRARYHFGYSRCCSCRSNIVSLLPHGCLAGESFGRGGSEVRGRRALRTGLWPYLRLLLCPSSSFLNYSSLFWFISSSSSLIK